MTLAIIFDSVGAGEWLVLLAVLLIVMGPKRLPSTARKIGSYYSKFRRAADSFKRQLMEMDMEMERELQNATKEAEDAVKIPDVADQSNGPGGSGSNGYGTGGADDGGSYYDDNPDYSGETDYHGEAGEHGGSGESAEPGEHSESSERSDTAAEPKKPVDLTSIKIHVN